MNNQQCRNASLDGIRLNNDEVILRLKFVVCLNRKHEQRPIVKVYCPIYAPYFISNNLSFMLTDFVLNTRDMVMEFKCANPIENSALFVELIQLNSLLERIDTTYRMLSGFGRHYSFSISEERTDKQFQILLEDNQNSKLELYDERLETPWMCQKLQNGLIGQIVELGSKFSCEPLGQQRGCINHEYTDDAPITSKVILTIGIGYLTQIKNERFKNEISEHVAFHISSEM